MTAIEILEKMDIQTQERIRMEYEALVKSSMKQRLNCMNPEDFLSQHPDITPILHGQTNYNLNPQLLIQFKAIMIPSGFGGIIERARWFALGR